MKKRRPAKPVRIELGKNLSDPGAIVAKLGHIIQAIRALQAEADWLADRMIEGLVAEGTLTSKDVARMNTLTARGKHRAAAEYFRSRIAAQD
jgi:hypothetical protein